MRNMLKLILIFVLCAGLLVLAGCGKNADQSANGETTTTPSENVDPTGTEEPTTEKPVNIVEDPLSNGEGDPLDALGGSDNTEPTIDVEIDDGGNTGGDNGDTGNNDSNPGGTTEKESEDDFEIDFGDLIGGK